MNYYAVGILMTVESSFIPFPSEVVIPPAVFVAANPNSTGGMKIWLIVLAGTVGAMLGAFINYYLSRWLGRPIIYAFVDSKVGHMLMLSGEKMERAEKYFNEHGIVSTLVGRLIPVVRQLISIPAGLSKMNVGTFALFTFIGAAAWNIVLAVIGYMAYKAGNLAIVKEYSSLIGNILLGLVALFAVWGIAKSIAKKRKSRVSNNATVAND
ncbi:MAG: DedA family protein [Bacteroidales bacterium]|nr:DedA family protein [Bacteroidales bacterium]